MANPYIPGDEDGKLFWLSNFAAKLPTYAASLGLTGTEPADMTTKSDAAAASRLASDNAQAAARAAIQTKRANIADAVSFARSLVARIQPHPAMTDTIRADLQITIPDTTPTPSSPDDVMNIPPPLVRLDWSVRRQITIHWGPNPGDERNNGRPSGTVGAQIMWARGGIPTNEASWVALEIDTDSPFIHHVDEDAPITLAYRARYVGKNLKFGPPSDPATCTVTP